MTTPTPGSQNQCGNAATPTGTTGTTGLGSSPRREFIPAAPANVSARTYQQGFQDGQEHKRLETSRQAMDAQKLPIGALGEHTPAVLLQRMALSAHQDAATGCIPSFTNRQTEALSEFHKGYLKGVEEANEKMKLVQEAAAEPPSPEEACLYVIELAQDVGLSLKSAHALASYFAAEMEQEGIE